MHLQCMRIGTARSVKVILLVQFDRPHDFLLVFRCSYVCILYRFRDIIGYFPKIKEVT